MASGTRAGLRLVFTTLAAAFLAWPVAAEPPRPTGQPVLTLKWGEAAGEVGFCNHRSPGFEDPVAMGPMAVVRLDGGNLVVADTFNNRLLVFDGRARLTQTVAPAGLRKPWLLAPLPEGGLAVVADETQQIFVLDASFKVTATLGGLGEKPGTFSQLDAIRACPGGALCCADLGTNLVSQLDSAGHPGTSMSWPGTGLEVDSRGRLLDLAPSQDQGYSLRARTKNGASEALFELPRDVGESGRLLGQDRAGGWWIRFARPDRPNRLQAIRLDSRGRQVGQTLELPHMVSGGAITVTPGGKLLWLDYDAVSAPEGKVVVREY